MENSSKKAIKHCSVNGVHKKMRSTTKTRNLISALVFLIYTVSPVQAQEESVWEECAAEKQYCYFEGTKTVRFGAGDSYAYNTFTNRVYCHVNTFGDPTPGVVKTCSYDTAITLSIDPIDNYDSALGEEIFIRANANHSADESISFLASGLPNGVFINNDTGEISGVLSSIGAFNVSIEIVSSSGETAAQTFTINVQAPGEWVVCATEKKNCDFSGDAEVRFGAAPNAYVFGNYTNGVFCSNNTFGVDPAPGQVKTCSFRKEATPLQVNQLGDQTAFLNYETVIQIAVASSTGTPTFSAQGLPPGFNLNTATGVISGTPTTEGEYDTTITVSDDANNSSTINLTWTVLGQKPVGTAMNSSQLIYLSKASANDEIWVANPDNDTVSVFDVQSDQKIAEIDVGQSPLSLAPFNNEVWVVNRDTSDISILSTQTYTEIETISLNEAVQPYAIVIDSISENFYVSLTATGEVQQINASSRIIEASLNLEKDIRGLSIDESSSYLYVSRFITPKVPGEETATPDTSNAGGELFVVSLSNFNLSETITLSHSDAIDSRSSGRGIPNYLSSMAISPDGTQGWIPSKQDNIKRGSARDGNNLNHENSVRAISSSIDLVNHSEELEARHDYDDASLASASIYHPSGDYLFVALETSREVAAVRLDSGEELRRIDVGIAPQALAISPDGNTLFVHNFVERTVTKHDIVSLLNNSATQAPLLATYALVENELLDSEVLLGKQLFYDAGDDRLALENYLSCASCHNDGSDDGRIWDLTGFGEGLRNTISLKGKAGLDHGQLHWSGNFDEVQDFEGQIRHLSGGTGLMDDIHFNSGTRSEPLGDTKAGISPDLDAISAYLSSLSTFDNSPNRGSSSSLSSAAEIGKALFSDSGCIDCHSGTTFSDSNDLVRHNVGTITTLSGKRLNSTLDGIDTPTLRDLWQTAPYLHDGSATTIEEAIESHNTATLSISDISAITQYLLELDDREASAPEESEWTLCATERKTCIFEGTRQVRYGAGSAYNFGTYTQQVLCNNSSFGDPIPGTAKSCYYRNTTEIVPTLNNPGQQTSILGSSINLIVSANDIDNLDVTYSAENLPDGLTLSGPGLISGIASTADSLTTTISLLIDGEVEDTTTFSWIVIDPDNPEESWIHCANERRFCAFNGEAEVRYGSAGTYNIETYSDGVSCNNNTFGDPTPGVAKTCEYRPTVDGGVALDQIDNQITELGSTVSLPISLSESGIGTLTFSAMNLPSGLTIDPANGFINGTVDTLGSNEVTITVNDSTNESDTSSFNWLVTEEPIAEETWITCANERQTCSFPGIKEVRYGANGSYIFRVYEDSVSCNNTTFGQDPAPGQVKTCDYRSNGNIAPIIVNPGSKLSAINLEVSFSIDATDPEGDSVTFTGSNLPAGISVNENTGLISGAPSEVGIYQVAIMATDESGESNQINFSWEVRTEVGGNENWVLCAREGDTCILPSGEEFKIYFGADNQYSSRFDVDAVHCGSPFFDDPIQGVVKDCYYEIVPEDDAWTKCADQNEYCSFTGTKLVRFGAQRAFDFRVATDGIDCSYDAFDEPIGGVLKRCEVRDITSDESYSDYPADIDNDTQWVYCAPNGLTCHFPGTKSVRYISGDEYVEMTATDTVFCSEESFPIDPVVSAKQLEHCEVLLDRSEVGEWSAPIDWPMIAVHASLMPDGRLLTHNATNDDLNVGYADVGLWDPATNAFSLLDPLTTTYGEQSSEMFCSGFDLMPDGNLLITGSEPNLTTNDNRNATRFDFRGERFSRINDNEVYRYYPSVTTMPSGDMVNFAGTLTEAPLEVFRFDGSWDVLNDTSDTYLNDFSYYAWGQVAPNGQLFYPGPDTEMKLFDLRGEGEETDSIPRGDGINRDYGSYAMYDIGKMFITGGGKPATDSTMMIDINGPSPVVTQASAMGMPRRHGNLTILADGSLLKTGGHSGSTHAGFQPEFAVFSSELWSPDTQQWTTLASMKINRLYHSTAILLPDGRVFSGGTGYPFNLVNNESNAEIFSPPYLFSEDGSLAIRPEITRAPKSLGYDHNFTVDIDSSLEIQKVHVIKLGTVTHHQNFGQRLVPLEFSQNGNTLELTSPEGPNLAPPGYYMLVVVDSDGRPSVAEIVQVQPYSTIHLKAQSNGLLLDIESSDTYANSFASVGAANAELSQLWSIHPSSDGYFKLISRSSGYALSAADALLTLGSDTDSQEEQWQFVPASDGYLALQSRSSGHYLALDLINPGQLKLSDTSSEVQATLWQISPVGDINIAGELSGQLLDAGDTELDGAEVYVADHSGKQSQSWYFESAGDGYSYIRSRSGSKALSLDNGRIVQQIFDGSDTQLWGLSVNQGGSFKIEAKTNQIAISANDDNADVGQSSIADNAEFWRFVPAVSGQPNNVSDNGGQVLYRSLVQETGLTLWKTNGQTAGNLDLSAAIETLEISTNGVRDDLGIEFQVYDEFSGWSQWATNNETAGEVGERISGLQAQLIDNAENCSLSYRVNTAATSWSTWYSQGNLAGSENPDSPILGIQITLVCSEYENLITTNASAEVTITAGNTDIDFSSTQSDALRISNSSLNENIERVEINIESAFLTDLVFDPLGLTSDILSSCFIEGTGGNETGFVSPIDSCNEPYSANKDGGYTTISLEFSHFAPGESFSFGTGISPTSIKNASDIGQADSVSGLELSGAEVTVYFDDGNTFTTELFPDGSEAGAKSCLNKQIKTTPTITLAGGGELPQNSLDDTLDIDIYGDANTLLKLFVVESALLGENGNDIDPFESNTAESITEYFVILDHIGHANLQVQISNTSVNGGYNHIIAASEDDSTGCNGRVSISAPIFYAP